MYRFTVVYFLFCLFLPLSAQTTVSDQEAARIRLVQANMPAVVTINVAYQDGSTFTGTGFVLTPEGLLATNRHVCENALYINTTFPDGIVSDEAEVVATDNQVDLALLKIPAQNLHTVQITPSAHALAGQDIVVIGNPRRLQNTVSTGIISQVRQKADGTIWYQISAPLSPSSSGSPVFNMKGEVMAVAFASLAGENNQNLNFAVPADYLRKLAESAGYQLPIDESHTPDKSTSPTAANPFLNHIKRSWQILCGFFKSAGPKDPDAK